MADRGLADFIGTFDVSREIADARAGLTTTFRGTAAIEPIDGGARYTETGVLSMGAQRFQAERTYLWRVEAGRIFVTFADGAPFHDFDPVTGGKRVNMSVAMICIAAAMISGNGPVGR